ncbi:butyrophilin subfamily 2 member A2-like [Chelmon rostratus]|uniref:butyrophilin subfamily 2 member A2-like n=1 Tax=Chelmon rostratus TaxID=109905 RepID=UPI001BEC58D0|nr:butyrophilin subfamily 2 member A2-like [Chelmon rostratus]
MYVCLLPVLALLLYSTGGAVEDSAPQKIVAFAGKRITLPCHINASNDLPTLEWSKEGPGDNIAFLYRDGCETHEMKSQDFQHRTNLFINELTNGNISLMISDVQLSDAGRYTCTIVRHKTPMKVVQWELVVVAVSEPKLSVVPPVDDGVTLQCEANCWFPEPEITFLDNQGNDISAENSYTDRDSSGCFNAKRSLTLQTHTKRIVCRVQQPETNETRLAEIYLPNEPTMSCTVPISIAAAVPVVLCAILLVCICRKWGNSAEGQKSPVTRQSSDQSETSSTFTAEGQKSPVTRQSSDQSETSSTAGFVQGNQAAIICNATAEHQRTNEELMVKLREKEETIQQLTEELNDLRSKWSPVVVQHGRPTIGSSPSKSPPDISKPNNLLRHHILQRSNPTPEASTNSNRPKSGNLPQNKDSKPGILSQNPAPNPLIRNVRHNHSCPALLTDNGAVPPVSPLAGPSEQSIVARSMSLSERQPRPNSARPQRRHTTTIPVYNRFTILENLPEDSVPLL